MRRVQDAVDDGIAHIQIGRTHVDLGSQAFFAVGVFSLSHFRKEAQIFLRGTVSVRALFARFGQRAAQIFDLFRGKVADERFAFFDQARRAIVDDVEEVGSVALFRPFVAHPADIAADGVHKFRLFFGRVGVVEKEVAFAAVFLGDPEIDEHALGVPDMQIAVGFGGKARLDRGDFSRVYILVDNLFDKIRRFDHKFFSVFIAVNFRITPLFYSKNPIIAKVFAENLRSS